MSIRFFHSFSPSLPPGFKPVVLGSVAYIPELNKLNKLKEVIILLGLVPDGGRFANANE